jgi:hypothetical protein
MAVTGQPSFRGGTTGLLAGLVRVVLLDVLFAVIMVSAAVAVTAGAERVSAGRAGPAPRWQYLLGAAGYLAVAAGFMLAGHDIGSGWIARASAVLGGWSALYGLVLLGRAACWGRVRTIFWWQGQLVSRCSAGRRLPR